jgi:hypothetical protein
MGSVEGSHNSAFRFVQAFSQWQTLRRGSKPARFTPKVSNIRGAPSFSPYPSWVPPNQHLLTPGFWLPLLELLLLPFHTRVYRSLQEVALKKQEDDQNRQHHQRGVGEQSSPFDRVRPY